MGNEKSTPLPKKNVLRQRPRLLYAGLNNNGEGWLNVMHAHPHPELMLVGGGSGKIKFNNAEYPFKKGDLVIYNKNVEHNEFMDAVPGRELYFWALGNLHLTGFEPDTLLKDKPFLIVPTESYFETLLFYVRSLIAETEGEQPFHESISEHLIKIILMFVLRIAAFDINLTFKQNDTYLEAKKYFDENFTKIESLESVCKSLYVNKYYLTHIFTQQMGIPPIKYLIGKRMELACQYLESGDANVGDIAKACGYVDVGYFCRVFKSVKNVTPLQYRYRFKQSKKNALT